MYTLERKSILQNLKLNNFSKENLSKIINNPSTERVIISGIGEPFNNKETIFEILKLSRGNKKIQILTNGLWILGDYEKEIFNKLNYFLKEKKDKYQIRISCDSFHIKQIGKNDYVKIIEKVINQIRNKENQVEVCFRGILEEKEDILNLLKKTFLESEKNVTYKSISNLETDIYLGDNTKLNFIFKNIVGSENSKKENTMERYIKYLEGIYHKPFTLGHLKTGKNGMDITIKPNGDLFFYGAEIYPLFNIFKDEIDINRLLNTIEDNYILKTLYSKTFLEIIKNLRVYTPFQEIINSVDNPYWIIKKMYASDKNKFKELIKCL
jgi:organic radical activating enzyme